MSTHWGMSPELNALISVIAQIKLPLLISFAVGVFIAVLAFFVLRPLIMSMTRNEANRVLMGFAESDREGRRFLDPSHPVALLRARHEGPCRRAADKGDELASFHSTDLHLVTCQPGLGLQDIGRPGLRRLVFGRGGNGRGRRAAGRRSAFWISRAASAMRADLVRELSAPVGPREIRA
jgi:hypothetical protein